MMAAIVTTGESLPVGTPSTNSDLGINSANDARNISSALPSSEVSTAVSISAGSDVHRNLLVNDFGGNSCLDQPCATLTRPPLHPSSVTPPGHSMRSELIDDNSNSANVGILKSIVLPTKGATMLNGERSEGKRKGEEDVQRDGPSTKRRNGSSYVKQVDQRQKSFLDVIREDNATVSFQVPFRNLILR